MKYLAVLGRLPKISLAELSSFFSDVRPVNFRVEDFGEGGAGVKFSLVTFSSEEEPEFWRFGGVLKFGEEIPGGFKGVLERLSSLPEGKITLGVSNFQRGANLRKTREEALKIKKILQRSGRSVRVLENKDAVLSTATSHHNQLAEKKNHVEIMITEVGNFQLTYVQNITEYARRDQARPARDAKVGMLPPKLAQILVNLNGGLAKGSMILDPFCGTGVVLQEAILDGYRVMGTDLNPRMVEYSRRNLEWLTSGEAGAKRLEPEEAAGRFRVAEGDATKFCWRESRELKELGGRIDGVAAEIFLGSPMSVEPGEIKLKEERERCRAILKGFLRNLSGQVESGTRVVLAIPAWRRTDGSYTRLGILDEIEETGYNREKYRNLRQEDLLYYREGQIVAREIIVLRRK